MAATKLHVPHVGFLVFILEKGRTVEDHYVLEKFAWITAVIEAFSKHKPRFYKIREDPAKIMQVGGWESVEQHYRDFHGSPRMRSILSEFGEVLDIRSNWHADIPFNEVWLDAPTLTLGRFYVLNAKRREFAAALPEWVAGISKRCGTKAIAGWRCDGGWHDQDDAADDLAEYRDKLPQMHPQGAEDLDDTIEWDILLPWSSIEKWKQVTGNRESMMPFFDLMKYVAKIEILHLDPMELPPVDSDRDDEDEDDEYDTGDSDDEG